MSLRCLFAGHVWKNATVGRVLEWAGYRCARCGKETIYFPSGGVR